MPLGKTNNPEGKNQYTNGGSKPSMLNAKMPVSSGRGGLEGFVKRVDPYAEGGKRGAEIGGKIERIATKTVAAVKGGVKEGLSNAKQGIAKNDAAEAVKGGVRGALSGAKRSATEAELNFAENQYQKGAKTGEKIGRKVAETMDDVGIAKEKVKDTAKETISKIRSKFKK